MNGLPVEDDEPAWRKLKLTLERPYTDDQGNPIRQLLDVTPEGQQIYEPYARTSLLLYSMTATRSHRFLGLRTPTSSLQKISAGCLLSEAMAFLRRGMLRAGGLTSGTPAGSMTRTKKPAEKPRIRLRSP